MLDSYLNKSFNFESRSKDYSNELEDYKNYILNQKELIQQIHQQQKKLRNYHKRNSSLSSLNNSINSHCSKVTFVPSMSSTSPTSSISTNQKVCFNPSHTSKVYPSCNYKRLHLSTSKLENSHSKPIRSQ